MARIKDRIYYIATNTKREETHALPIVLNEQGHADLSQLPQKLRRELSSMGIRNKGFGGQLFPEDGLRFLKALLQSVNGYGPTYRVTIDPKLITTLN